MIAIIIFVFFLNFLPLFYGTFFAFIPNNSFTLSVLLATLKAKYFYLSLIISVLYAILSSILSTYIALYLSKVLKKILIFLIIGWVIPPYIGVPIFRTFFEKYTDITVNPVLSFVVSILISSWFLIPFSAFFLYSYIKNINQKYLEAFLLDSNNISLYYNKIVIPNIKGAISAVLFLNFISAFKDFQVPWLLLEGGAPMKIGITNKGIIGATTNLEVLIYKFFNQNIDTSKIAAIFTLTITFLSSFYFFRKKIRIKFNISIFNKILAYIWIFTIIAFFLIIINLSFSSSPSIYLKGHFTLDNFQKVFSKDFFNSFFNTFIISFSVSFLGIFLSTYFAFKLLHFRFGKSFLAFFNFSKIFFGLHSLIFIFYIFSKIHILNTFFSVILVITSKNLPFLTLLSFYTFKDFPEELFYLSKLDGLSNNKFFFKILIPNNFPLISSLFLLSTLNSFNSFLPPLLFLYDAKKYPLSLLLYNYVGTISNHYPQWNVFSAISIINLLILIFLSIILIKITDISHLQYY
ncbi:ABC transporter permease [Thermosipho affectus]|uniref:ABC transporter permease n=1 Tax=Thermosipho affectus TaxID=660294 RepID=A0ABX3IKJ8_9BACT|nr:ABC transporter permease subunit [Thermosipho affectus]ONN27848.1 ABC transporter permease [Thermosipho affectus]